MTPRWLTTPVILLGMAGLCAQQPASEKSGKTDYSQEAAVIESLTEKVEFQNDGSAIYEHAMRARIQSDAGVKQFGILAFSYAQANQTLEIEYVRVVKPDGTIINTPNQNIQDLPADVTRTSRIFRPT